MVTIQKKNCGDTSAYGEERWNYAFWRQSTTHIINPHESNNEGMENLFQWYIANGIVNIGYEDFDNAYDENMRYIGKGPIGYYELLTLVSYVARQLQIEGFVSKRYGHIPIIIHGLEYCWYVEEATAQANPNGEADVFLEAVKRNFI